MKNKYPAERSEDECEILNNNLVDKDYIFTCLGKHSLNSSIIGYTDEKPSILEE